MTYYDIFTSDLWYISNDEMLDHKTFHFQRHLPSRGQTTELRQESNQSNAGATCRISLVLRFIAGFAHLEIKHKFKVFCKSWVLISGCVGHVCSMISTFCNEYLVYFFLKEKYLHFNLDRFHEQCHRCRTLMIPQKKPWFLFVSTGSGLLLALLGVAALARRCETWWFGHLEKEIPHF